MRAPAQQTPAERAVDAVRGGGKPLPPDVQREAFDRYGFGFGHVRVHDGPPANAAAKSLRASAYTIGSDIAFAAGRYDPGAASGRALLRHELRHVAQQHWAAATLNPQVDGRDSAHERDAREPFAQQVPALAEQRIQCAPEEETFSLGTGLVDTVGRKATSDRSWPFIKAVLEGFAGGLKSDIQAGRADAAKSHLSELMRPWNAAKFYGGYLVGLVIGLVSPVTDLVKGVVGLVKLGAAGLEWLVKWSPVGVVLSAERRAKIAQLGVKLNALMGELGTSLKAFVADPKGTVQKFSGFLEDLMQMALSKARGMGARAAHALFDFLGRDFYEMGKGIGEVIGTLIAQLLLLIFSEAIGNLVTKGASFLGKAAEFVAGKAVEAFTWLKGIFVEALGLLRSALKGALKAFEGVVNKAIEAFDALVELLSKTEAIGAGERAAAGVGRGVPGAISTNMESRMVSSGRSTTTTVADLRTPKVHPSNVPKQQPASVPGSAEKSLAKAESELTPEQLRQKHILEEFEERQAAAYDVAEKETVTARGRQEAGKVRAGMKAKPKHHVLPQEHRAWFKERGFEGKLDIDQLTVELAEAEHQAIHGGGNYRLGRTTGFEWNTRVMAELRRQELALGGRLLTPREILTTVRRLMDEYRIPGRFVPYK